MTSVRPLIKIRFLPLGLLIRKIEHIDAGPQMPSQMQGLQKQRQMVNPLGVKETMTSISKWRQKPSRNLSKWAVVARTLRH
jgi:hypothetical protein